MKKTEYITSKISPETKTKLQTLANEKEWTLSHLVNRILEDYQEKLSDVERDHDDQQNQKGENEVIK